MHRHLWQPVANLVSLLVFCLMSAPTAAQSMPVAAQNYADRTDVRAFINDVAQRDGIAVSELENILNQVKPVPVVIDLIKPPTQPNVRSWQRYRERFIDHATKVAGLFQERGALRIVDGWGIDA